MGIKKAAELFGDDGANGPRAPIDEAPFPGLGPKNRAIGFGEQLTSMTGNRATYALALNDEDLDTRISVFELGGLDAAYRLGAVNTPGGGRVIAADGGAVEVQTAHESLFDTDRANAAVRARLDADVATGGVGFDAVSRGGTGADAGPGASAFGFLDRRALAFDTIYTKLALTEQGVLNPNGADATVIEIDAGSDAFFEGSEGTDLLASVDFIEILDSGFAGLYPITDVDGRRATLGQLDRDVPHFAPNTAVTFRLFRATFAAGSIEGHGGAQLAALPAAGAVEVLRLAHSTDDVGRFLVARGRYGNIMASLDTGGSLVLNGGVTTSRVDAANFVGSKAVITQIDVQKLGPTNLSSTLVVYPKTTFRDVATFKEDAYFERDVYIAGAIQADSLTLNTAFDVNAAMSADSLTVVNDTTLNNVITNGTLRANGPFLLGPGREVLYADAGGVPTPRLRNTMHPLIGNGAPFTGAVWGSTGSGVTLKCDSDIGVSPYYECSIILPVGAVLKHWYVLAMPSGGFGVKTIRGGARLAKGRADFWTVSNTYEEVEPVSVMVNGTAFTYEVLQSSIDLDVVIDGTFSLVLGFYITTRKAGEQVTLGAGGIGLTWLDPGPRSG